MTPRAWQRLLSLAVLAGLALALEALAPQPGGPATITSDIAATPLPEGWVRVAAAVDGDTLELEGGEKVRLIGVDTPETVHPSKPVQCFGTEASAYTKSLIAGKAVRLERDISDTDRYGRLLRYVWLDDGTLLNLALVRDGYATVSTYPPDVAYAADFRAAQTAARAAGRGLWAACK